MNDIKMNSKYIYLMTCNLYDKKYSFFVNYFRSRRRRHRESRDIVGHHDGLSSDDEQNQSEITKFNLEKGGQIFYCYFAV